MTGARDTYDGWTEIKPSADFVDYYKNADGSDFKWSEVDGLEDWDLLTPQQREIFFCRDGLESMSSQKCPYQTGRRRYLSEILPSTVVMKPVSKGV